MHVSVWPSPRPNHKGGASRKGEGRKGRASRAVKSKITTQSTKYPKAKASRAFPSKCHGAGGAGLVWAEEGEERLRGHRPPQVGEAHNLGGTAGLPLASEILHQQVKSKSVTAR
jgi:hypothetical protein